MYNLCDGGPCVEDLEGTASQTSLASIASNIRGFRTLFRGGDGKGMNDLLVHLGHGDLAEQILRDSSEALALAEGMEEPLENAILEQDPSVVALHDALVRIKQALERDMATVLHMNVPCFCGETD